MQRSISLSLTLGGAAAFALANAPLLPATAQDNGGADELGGVMSISLQDAIKPTVGFQGALQGAGTPNQAGLVSQLNWQFILFWFWCQAVPDSCWIFGRNSVLDLDALANVNFSDFSGYSSIINTEVAGTTISSSYTVTAS